MAAAALALGEKHLSAPLPAHANHDRIGLAKRDRRPGLHRLNLEPARTTSRRSRPVRNSDSGGPAAKSKSRPMHGRLWMEEPKVLEDREIDRRDPDR